MSTYCITGAGRGIGLELARQLSKLSQDQVSKIFVTTRGQPSELLSGLIATSAGRVIHVPCEVTVPETINKAVALIDSELSGNGLDVLVNNAGIQTINPDGITTMTDKQLLDEFNTNVVSVHRMIAAFVPLLNKGNSKTIINISTTMGSIAYASKFAGAPTPAYKITKAGLNMLTVQYALELEQYGFKVLAVSPGWLKTDMGSSYADLEVETGVQAVVKIILSVKPEMNGKHLNIHIPGWEEADGPNQYDGREIPW